MNVEIYFNETIARYNLFKQAAVVLIKDVPSLSPEEIYYRCEKLTAMHQELLEKKEQLFIIVEFFGPGILDTAYIGEFQRTLDKSISACDSLYQEILTYRKKLEEIAQKSGFSISHSRPCRTITTLQ
jgi:hypothetical protein